MTIIVNETQYDKLLSKVLILKELKLADGMYQITFVTFDAHRYVTMLSGDLNQGLRNARSVRAADRL